MLQLVHVTFACSDPGRVAEFWSALLEYERAPAGDGWTAKDPRGEGPTLLFNRMEKSPTIEIPIHLDVNVPAGCAPNLEPFVSLFVPARGERHAVHSHDVCVFEGHGLLESLVGINQDKLATRADSGSDVVFTAAFLASLEAKTKSAFDYVPGVRVFTGPRALSTEMFFEETVGTDDSPEVIHQPA